jgi:hypothetical protein
MMCTLHWNFNYREFGYNEHVFSQWFELLWMVMGFTFLDPTLVDLRFTFLNPMLINGLDTSFRFLFI